MNKHVIKLVVLSVLSGICLWLGWPPFQSTILLFVCFVPLLIVEQDTRVHKRPLWVYFALIYFSLLLWNVATTYWLYNAVTSAIIAVHVINPLLFTVPFLIYRLVKIKSGTVYGVTALVSSWITMEYIHHTWELAYPFLTLGNGISTYPAWIQFYELTGVWGGSLWIWMVNVSIYYSIVSIRKAPNMRSVLRRAWPPLITFTVPLLLSYYLFYSYKEKGVPVNVIAVHTNVDVRSEKYGKDVKKLVDKYFTITQDLIDETTDYVIWPESAVPDAGWISQLNRSKTIDHIRKRIQNFPELNLITGAILYEKYNENEAIENVQHISYSEQSEVWYYTYSAAFQLSGIDKRIPIRTKNKLVPVEERIPFAKRFVSLRKIFPSLGGFTLSTRQYNNNVFDSNSKIKTSTLICYESLFGSLSSEYVYDGADLLFMLFNEGWYKHLKGAKQFMHYASIRAIENRRSIVRASNDGISCFINQKGEIKQMRSDFSPGAIKGTVNANSRRTIYTIFGDVLAYIMIITFIYILSYYIVSIFNKRRKLQRGSVI